MASFLLNILSLLLFESGLLDFLLDVVSPPEPQVPMGAVEALVAPNPKLMVQYPFK